MTLAQIQSFLELEDERPSQLGNRTKLGRSVHCSSTGPKPGRRGKSRKRCYQGEPATQRACGEHQSIPARGNFRPVEQALECAVFPSAGQEEVSMREVCGHHTGGDSSASGTALHPFLSPRHLEMFLSITS